MLGRQIQSEAHFKHKFAFGADPQSLVRTQVMIYYEMKEMKNFRTWSSAGIEPWTSVSEGAALTTEPWWLNQQNSNCKLLFIGCGKLVLSLSTISYYVTSAT